MFTNVLSVTSNQNVNTNLNHLHLSELYSHSYNVGTVQSVFFKAIKAVFMCTVCLDLCCVCPPCASLLFCFRFIMFTPFCREGFYLRCEMVYFHNHLNNLANKRDIKMLSKDFISILSIQLFCNFFSLQ